MATELHHEHRYPASAEELFAIVVDPEFLAARHKAQGAVSARVREIHRDEARLVHDVETEEHVHTMRGVDEKRTETVSTRYEWDLAARTGSWTYHGSRGKRLQIGGRIAVIADGDRARLASDFRVEVRAPLIGGMIERRIIAEIKASLPRVETVTNERCRRLS
jgi:hypothetical protein